MAQQPESGDKPSAGATAIKWYEKPSTIFGGLFVLVGGIVGVWTAAYSVGKDVGEGNLKSYQELNALGLPEMVKSAGETTSALRQATAQFSEMLVNNQTYTEMKEEVEKAKATQEAAKKQAADAAARASDLQARLDAATERIEQLTPRGEKVTLKQGQSHLAINEINIGVETIYPSFASIVVDSNPSHVSVGSSFRVDSVHKGYYCTVKVVELIASESLTLLVDCRGPEQAGDTP